MGHTLSAFHTISTKKSPFPAPRHTQRIPQGSTHRPAIPMGMLGRAGGKPYRLTSALAFPTRMCHYGAFGQAGHKTEIEMALTFPTQAEQCVRAFLSTTKTISLATIAKKMGAEKRVADGITSYTFDDDTTLEVQGRGRQHKFETFYP